VKIISSVRSESEQTEHISTPLFSHSALTEFGS